MNAYHVKCHPHVVSRRKSPEEVLDQVRSGMCRKVVNDVVSREGFVDYYAELNFCIPNER